MAFALMKFSNVMKFGFLEENVQRNVHYPGREKKVRPQPMKSKLTLLPCANGNGDLKIKCSENINQEVQVTDHV